MVWQFAMGGDMKTMKALLLAGLALGTLDTLGTLAQAADFPVALKAAPPIAYRWTNCYLGVHAGYGWRGNTSRHTDDPNNPDPFQGVGAVLPLSYDTKSNSSVAGGQVGCDMQVSERFVVGLEGGYSAMRLDGSSSTTVTANPFATNIGPVLALIPPGTFTANEQVSQRWLATFTARAGGLVFDRLLLYVTGGAAFGSVTATGSVKADALIASAVWTGTTSEVRAGYVVGAGAEYAIDRNWSIKAEYLHYDLGTIQHSLLLGPNTLGPGVFAAVGSTSTRITNDVVRVGVNFRFGGLVTGY
jgi:outer membrane immunogenic protein